jgi:L-lactate utilization protein LutB
MMIELIDKRADDRGDGAEADPVSTRRKKLAKGGNMREGEKDYFRKRVPKILEALKKKGYVPYFFESTDQARSFILERIDPSETVAIGGSITIREDLSIKEELRKRGNQVIDHWEASGDRTRVIELKRKNREADVFLSGLNAISSDGILVNLDGGGNRVASLCSGPKRVIVVAGANKIVESVDLGIHRTRKKVAVMTALRLNAKVPCVQTGECIDCDVPGRICAALLILMKKPGDIDEFSVILVNEYLGF